MIKRHKHVVRIILIRVSKNVDNAMRVVIHVLEINLIIADHVILV
jgi:hypothetical protein